MPNFTPFQASAIAFQDGNCLVSAGAGSGKTAVLTQRVYRLITPPLDKDFARDYALRHNGEEWNPESNEEPVFEKGAKPACDCRELLVLTFGKGAAIEMKERVRSFLSAHKATLKYLPDIEASDITNFDSFYLKLVNEYPFELGLRGKASIIDEGYVNILTLRIINELLDEKYKGVIEGKEADFAEILRKNSVKDDSNIVSRILSVLSLSTLFVDPEVFFDEYESRYCSEDFYVSCFFEFESRIRARLRLLIDPIRHYYDNDALADADIAAIQAYLDAPDFDSMVKVKLSGEAVFPARRAKIYKEFSAEEERAEISKTFKELTGLLTQDAKAFLDEAKENEAYAKVFIALAREVYKRRFAFMKDNLLFDFPSIATLATKLLEKKAIKEEFKKRYRYIMVDEYQDTSILQEAFIQSLAKDNVFAVGDIKQSIYRFRKANPKTFADKLEKYRKNEGGTLITLPDNFRSREETIKGVNDLFSRIMKPSVGGVDYSLGHALRFGNKGYLATAKEESYGFKTIHYGQVDGESRTLTEARLIAADIANKKRSQFKVRDRKTGKARPCDFGDFAILVSRKSGFGDYIEAFKEVGIPLSVRNNIVIENDDIILTLSSLLSLIDSFQNKKTEEKDIFPHCLSLARSFLFRMNDDEIYEIFKSKDMKRFPFYEQIRSFALANRALSLSELLLEISLEFSLPSALLSLGKVKENYQKIISLTKYAETMEQTGVGLSGFLDYLQELRDNGFSMEVDSGTLEKTAVKLMSDHYSKGLQYKICYYPELFSSFRGTSKKFSATTDYGVVFSMNEEKDLQGNYLGILSKWREESEDKSERMRLFYVALTRAEEMGILMIPHKKGKDGEEKNMAPVFLESAKSFLQFYLYSGIDFPSSPTPNPDVKPFSMSDNPAKRADFNRIPVEEVSCFGTSIHHERASHELTSPIDPGILARGRRLHRIMEFVSFKKKTIPNFLSPAEESKIKAILSDPVFANADKAIEYHEYDYIDPNTGVEGIIDCFLLYDDHIDLIDFKSSTIDEDIYGGQLDHYAAYLSLVFPGKRIDKYLISIGKAEVKRVD